MDNNKIIAETLLDLSKASKSEIIELAQDDELIKIAEKIGIVIPSPDLGIIKTIYAQVDVANRNGVRLPKEAVIKALPTLRLKQANWSHMGKNYICGFIIDGKLEGNDIIIYTAIYKSLFVEEWDKAKELFANNDLSVSFEIWSILPETGESCVKFNDDGTRTIDPICFHGVGILIGDGEKPACPKAYVKKLLAIFNIDKYEKITEKKYTENLVTASMAIEEPKCLHCDKCQCEGGEKIVEELTDEQVIELATAPVVAEVPKEEIITEPIKELVASEETKVEDVVPAVETKPEEIVETPKEEVAAEIAVPVSVVKWTVEEKYITEETPAEDGSRTILKRGMIVKITEWSDGKKDVTEEEFADVVKYSQAELDAQVVAIKADLEKTYNEQLGIKETEIATLKAEVEVKKTEITTIKTEQAKVVEEANADLGVGSVNVEERDKDIAVQNRVTAQAFPVKK